MSSFNKESINIPSSSQPQNALLDSGLGSSITPLSGSFGEGYQLLSGSYELEYDYDEGGPLSLQPASQPLLTTVIDNPSQQVSGDEQNEDSNSSSTVAHSSETGSSSSTTACTIAAAYTASIDINSDSKSSDRCTTNATHTDLDINGDLLMNSSDSCTTNACTAQTDLDLKKYLSDLDRCPSDPNPIDDGVISNSQDENSSEPDAKQDQNDIPSPVLSHVRAQPLEIVIRGSVVEDRPEVISERILTESARAHSPP